MSQFSGKQGRGAMRARKEVKRKEAEARAAAFLARLEEQEQKKTEDS